MYIDQNGCEESNSTPKARRVFYTVELDKGYYIDVMIAEDIKIVYVMQNDDGSTVYDNEQTYPEFSYDENEAILLAKQAFEKEYGKTVSF